jgi:hypothetical protein
MTANILTGWSEEIDEALAELPDAQRSRAVALIDQVWKLALECVKNVDNEFLDALNEQYDAVIDELSALDDGFIADCLDDEIKEKLTGTQTNGN